MAIIEIRHVSRSFGRRETNVALDDVSLEIEAGAFVVIHGPSGSGKSSLLALIGGLDRSTAGEVIVDGVNLSSCAETWLTRTRRKIGFVFQQFSLVPQMTAADNITIPLVALGKGRSERDEIAQHWLSELGLSDKQDQLPNQLSGGEQQRVAVGRALATAPEILIADEPTSNLDPATARIVMEQFRAVHRAGCTVIVATHDRTVSAATQYVEMENGNLVLDQSPPNNAS